MIAIGKDMANKIFDINIKEKHYDIKKKLPVEKTVKVIKLTGDGAVKKAYYGYGNNKKVLKFLLEKWLHYRRSCGNYSKRL